MYRITKIAISLIIVLVIGTTSCYALEEIKVEQGSVLSLRDCIAIALNNNPEIKSARYNYGISKANVNIARSEFFPTVGIGTGYNFNGVDSKRTLFRVDIDSSQDVSPDEIEYHDQDNHIVSERIEYLC